MDNSQHSSRMPRLAFNLFLLLLTAVGACLATDAGRSFLSSFFAQTHFNKITSQPTLWGTVLRESEAGKISYFEIGETVFAGENEHNETVEVVHAGFSMDNVHLTVILRDKARRYSATHQLTLVSSGMTIVPVRGVELYICHPPHRVGEGRDQRSVLTIFQPFKK